MKNVTAPAPIPTRLISGQITVDVEGSTLEYLPVTTESESGFAKVFDVDGSTLCRYSITDDLHADLDGIVDLVLAMLDRDGFVRSAGFRTVALGGRSGTACLGLDERKGGWDLIVSRSDWDDIVENFIPTGRRIALQTAAAYLDPAIVSPRMA